MGSFQQIAIGIVCLVAAFAFGNYVNNHPPGEHPRDTAGSADPVVDIQGNIQSRLVGEIELTEKRPANIATMRSRLEPRFAMPSSNANPDRSTAAPKIGSLPPPSQLDSKPVGRKGPPTLVPTDQMTDENPLDTLLALENNDGSAVVPRAAKSSDVPDFSTIMNELDGSSIALQPIGKMPQHSESAQERSVLAVVKPRTQEQDAPLAELANEFKSAAAQSGSNSNQPWDSRQSASFTAEDFSPQLKESSLEVRSPASAQSTAENSSRPANHNSDPLSTAGRYEIVAENSNRVVSREPIPAPSGNQAILPPLITPQNSTARVANLKPSSANRSPNDTGTSGVNVASPNLEPPVNQVRSKIPFALNDQGKRQLAELRSRTSSQLALNTTRYVDHVIQPGESLQSISKRYFGNPDYYLDIYLANRGKLKNPASLETGIAIRIPIYE